ncbi:vitamin K-dependent protein Z-like isoform X2 [Brienomyrus brachyistius]|uniref:vitamin K-dependent protein Z-like isoform X2 n=1 Tax=Brienomyrus brachyistius TaxID=42636 RepID=UPI0020B40B88|nr:vitamin K-dependent protein Z-like isoform X2 [Brienomyrus brachyistius]
MQNAMSGLTLSLLLLPLCAADVFLRPYDAHSVLHRPRRANTGLLEELRQGSLERECIEEVCDYEEAREVFEDDALMNRFWTMYRNRNPCDPNPCLNNRNCVHFQSIYQCQCPRGSKGDTGKKPE